MDANTGSGRARAKDEQWRPGWIIFIVAQVGDGVRGVAGVACGIATLLKVRSDVLSTLSCVIDRHAVRFARREGLQPIISRGIQ